MLGKLPEKKVKDEDDCYTRITRKKKNVSPQRVLFSLGGDFMRYELYVKVNVDAALDVKTHMKRMWILI